MLPKDRSIFEQDAVLAYDEKIHRRDPATGEILTLWDGHSTKPHPITGKEVVQGCCKRFGFITTNSIHQTFNRCVMEGFLQGRDGSPSRPADGKRMAKNKKSSRDHPLEDSSSTHLHGLPGGRSLPIHLAYAIPDHPWIDSADGAAVRIAMTVAAPGHAEGILEKVITEIAHEDGENEVTLLRSGGLIAPNLQIGADVSSRTPLGANATLAHRGVQTIGAGFIISPDEATALGFPRYSCPLGTMKAWTLSPVTVSK